MYQHLELRQTHRMSGLQQNRRFLVEITRCARRGIIPLFLIFCFFPLTDVSPLHACFVNDLVCDPGQEQEPIIMYQWETDVFRVQCSSGCVAMVTVSVDDPNLVTVTPPTPIEIDWDTVMFIVKSGKNTGSAIITIAWSCPPWSGSCQIPITVNRWDPPKPTSNGNKPYSETLGDPVNTSNGELHFYEPYDLYLGGLMPLYFQRYYASHLRESLIFGALGNNWLHNFDLTFYWDGNEATFVNETGRVTTFNKSGGEWIQENNKYIPYQVIAQTGQDAMVYDPFTERIFTFDYTNGGYATGQVIQIENKHGNKHYLSYDSGGLLQTVSDDFDRTLTFSHAEGKIIDVSDGTRTVSYGYNDPENPHNLTHFIDVMGNETIYNYENMDKSDHFGLLLHKTLPENNIPYIQTYYDSGSTKGWVETQTDAYGNVFQVNYDNLTGTTTVQNPLGNTRTHVYDQGRLASCMDEAGNLTTFASDGAGRRNAVTDPQEAVFGLSFQDESGKITGLTDAEGNPFQATYTVRQHWSGIEFQELTGIIHPDGTDEDYIYDNFGNRTTWIDQAERTWLYTYNEDGQVLTATNPEGGIFTYTYDENGNLVSVEDSLGNTTQFTYDIFSRVSQITWADGAFRTIEYDLGGHITKIIDERDHEMPRTYDRNGNLISLTDPLDNTVLFQYDLMDRPVAIIDALGNTSTVSYDELGRPFQMTDRDDNVTVKQYDEAGHLNQLTDPVGNIWRFVFNSAARLVSVADPLSNTWVTLYDLVGQTTQISSPMGNDTHFTYNSLGLISSIIDPMGVTTQLTYDVKGLVSGVSLANGQITASYVRNGLGLITEITDPNDNVWWFFPDALGRLTSKMDPLGNQVSYQYDARNRVSKKLFPSLKGDLDLSYDQSGNLTQLSFSDGTILNYSYDDNGLLTTADGVSISYDNRRDMATCNGINIDWNLERRMESVTFAPGKAITYAYDERGLLTGVSDWAGGLVTLGYDDAARLTTMSRSNGVTTTFSYNEDSQINGITEGSIASIAFTRNANGQVVGADRNLPNETWFDLGYITSLGYDAACQIQSAYGYTYDNMGRLTGDRIRSYSWDLASRLTSYGDDKSTVQFTYDGMHNLLTRGTDEYVWNYAFLLTSVSIIRSGGLNDRYFVHAPDGTLLYCIESGDDSRRFYHFDEMGNTLFLTDDAGAVTDTYAYTPYGVLIDETGSFENPFTYGGRYGVMREGDTSLYFMRRRVYDSATGRFLARDPVGDKIFPLKVNPYQYAMNDPLRFNDPLGLDSTVDDVIDILSGLSNTSQKGVDWYENFGDLSWLQKRKAGNVGSKLTLISSVLELGKGIKKAWEAGDRAGEALLELSKRHHDLLDLIQQMRFKKIITREEERKIAALLWEAYEAQKDALYDNAMTEGWTIGATSAINILSGAIPFGLGPKGEEIIPQGSSKEWSVRGAIGGVFAGVRDVIPGVSLW